MLQNVKELSNKYNTNAKYLLLANVGFILLAILTGGLSWILGEALLLVPIVVLIVIPYFILVSLQPFNLIYGIYGLVKFKNIKYGLTLFLLGGLLLNSFVFLKIGQHNKAREDKMEAIELASSRYEELLQKFSEPQVVTKVNDNDTLSFQDNLSVRPIINGVPPTPHVYHEEFKEYARKNMVGNKVEIQLPAKEEFLKSYSDGRAYNYGESFWAEVYFNNKLIDLREYGGLSNL